MERVADEHISDISRLLDEEMEYLEYRVDEVVEGRDKMEEPLVDLLPVVSQMFDECMLVLRRAQRWMEECVNRDRPVPRKIKRDLRPVRSEVIARLEDIARCIEEAKELIGLGEI